MPCKHEGGSDACVKYRNGACKIRTRKTYDPMSISSDRRDWGKVGKACELLVQLDLLKRGFEVTVPLNPCAQHDLHVRLPKGWVGVQVKAARTTLGGDVRARNLRTVSSPLLALVLLRNNQIIYRSGTKKVPPELL